MAALHKNIVLSLISLILCHFIAHGFSLHQTDATCLTATPDTTQLSCVETRGGASNNVNPHSRKIILDFLSSNSQNGDFHIQGWRWHFMSLIRDTERLERLAVYLSQHEHEDLKIIESAADFLINFNMAGLHRVEGEMFVAWLRSKLCDAAVVGEYCEDGKGVADAFRDVIDTVDEYRVQSSKMGNELYAKAKAAVNKPDKRQQNLNDVIQLSSQLSERLQQMRTLQETLVVPAISVVVPSKSQKSFNNRVLLKLGVLESRVHLVGMHDAVWQSGIESEKAKFETEIPYVARLMIERWRKSLYNPKAEMLDYGLN